MMTEHRFILDCVLGLSAAHYSLVSENPDTAQLALYYRSQAFKGVRLGVSRFSERNADALIAASILLTWFQCDW
jgi:hypothetical protein